MGGGDFGVWKPFAGGPLRGRTACAVVLTVAVALLVPAGASASAPVLEFVVPGNHLPVGFTTESGQVTAEMAGFSSLVHCEASHGTGEITGPRSTVSEYTFTGCVTERGSNVKCHSAGAKAEEIRTGPIEADLVYIGQAQDEVGMLLDPGGGTYIAFECGGEQAEGRGPFLAPGSPINTEASAFTVTLSQSGSLQTPDEYEGVGGEELLAIPMGEHGGGKLVTTGVQAAFTVKTSVPVDVRAISAVEVLLGQFAEEAATKKRQEEQAAVRKGQEEEAAATAARKRQEEEAAASHKREEQAAVRKRLEAKTLAALRSAISRAHPKILALLEHGGLTETFAAPEPGVVVIQWWWMPPGAHLAKKSKRDPMLVGSGSAVFSVAGTGKVKVNLTGAGRRLLASANDLKLTASVRFTPTAHPPIVATGISATGVVRLKR
jgi:hypothetical protein